MAIITVKDTFGTIQVRGKLGQPGMLDPLGIGGIYKVRRYKQGFVQIKMPYYKPTGAPSLAQISQRGKMRTAVLMWQALTSDQKLPYKIRGRKKQMTGFCWYLHLVMPTL